jgi:hypothetical protein
LTKIVALHQNNLIPLLSALRIPLRSLMAKEILVSLPCGGEDSVASGIYADIL